MSFKSLLFCPDEKTARVVTQVLSELDFTVETESESFAAVKRLTEEQFHALVVDCQNEQDASLLFKAARNSAHNSSSLSVAVVEGQAGVAKAFRIGANLVLTKPINVEQSKGTLRVARGLLKKTQTRPTSPSPAISGNEPAVPQKQSENFFSKPSYVPKPTSDPAMVAPVASTQSTAFPAGPASVVFAPKPAPASVPFSGLVLESDPEPAAQAEDLALLESLPQITGKRVTEPPPSTLLGQAGPIAASTSGQAAATAPALDTKVLEFKTAGAAPMVTNQAIVSEVAPVAAFSAEAVAPPTFSALESASKPSAGGGRFLKIAVLLAVLAGGGYYAWKLPVTQQFLHRGNAAQVTPAPSGDSANASEPADFQPPVETTPSTSATQNGHGSAVPSTSAEKAQAPSHAAIAKKATEEPIEFQELPMTRDSGKTTVTPKPEPIMVKGDTVIQKPSQPTAPPVDLVAGSSSATLPNLAPSNLELPKPSPGTIRVSQGVSQGLLIKKTQPIYPAIAKQLNKSGTVQLLATVTKAGAVSKIQVLGGDPMLSRAAVDAVKQWQYRPYLLNGLPVEIETQITIVFNGIH